MKLDDIRKKIDKIDEKILSNLAERMRLVVQARKLKNRLGLPIVDKSREAKLISALKSKGQKLGLSSSFVVEIFSSIISESKNIQKRL